MSNFSMHWLHVPDDIDVLFECKQKKDQEFILPEFPDYVCQQYTFKSSDKDRTRGFFKEVFENSLKGIAYYNSKINGSEIPAESVITELNGTRMLLNQIMCHCTIRDFFDYVDLDFCNIAFDGRKLMIYDFDSIVNRKCVFDLTKYMDVRGINVNDKGFKLMNYMLNERIEKYKNRGYEIKELFKLTSKTTYYIQENDE